LRSECYELTDSRPRDPIIKLLVGKNHEILNVHQGVLRKSSQYFRNAIKPGWGERRGCPGCLDLSQHDLESVMLYVRWLYSHELLIKLAEPGSYSDKEATPELRRTHIELAQAYVFGERVMDNKFKNAVMSKFLEFERVSKWTPGYEAAVIIYEGTVAGSPIRRLLADLVAHNASTKPIWAGYFDDYPRDLLVDALTAMTALRPSPTDHAYLPLPIAYLEVEEF
jgi:hypothetical protein